MERGRGFAPRSRGGPPSRGILRGRGGFSSERGRGIIRGSMTRGRGGLPPSRGGLDGPPIDRGIPRGRGRGSGEYVPRGMGFRGRGRGGERGSPRGMPMRGSYSPRGAGGRGGTMGGSSYPPKRPMGPPSGSLIPKRGRYDSYTNGYSSQQSYDSRSEYPPQSYDGGYNTGSGYGDGGNYNSSSYNPPEQQNSSYSSYHNSGYDGNEYETSYEPHYAQPEYETYPKSRHYESEGQYSGYNSGGYAQPSYEPSGGYGGNSGGGYGSQGYGRDYSSQQRPRY